MQRRAIVVGLVMSTGLAAAAPIVGGTKTAVGDFPSVVAIEVGAGICTGTLISPTWVLTAGHCIDPTVVQEPDHAAVVASIKVHVHTVDVVHAAGTIYKAKSAIGAGFVNGVFGKHDMSLIELSSPVTDVAPAIVNLSAGKAPIGLASTMVGYGKTTVGAGTPGSVGVEFVVTARMSGPCATVVSNAPQIQPPLSDANVLCFAQGDGKGKCEGDSGGPTFAMIDGVAQVIGVTSFGDNDCAVFGVDTRTDIESDFLVANVTDLCSAGTDCSGAGDSSGCCSSSGNPAAIAVGLGGFALVLRRRRR